MNVNNLSKEVGAAIIELSAVAHDQTISESERNQKLSLLKSSVISKIDAEGNTITFAGKTFLKEIKEIIADEDWAALPDPKKITNTLSEMKTLVAILNSLDQQLLPTIEAIQRFFIESALKQITSLSNSEISSISKQWEAASKQFEHSAMAAWQERTSGIISAAVGIGVAAMSIVAKGAVTLASSKSFDKARPDSEMKNNMHNVDQAKAEAKTKFEKAKEVFDKVDNEFEQKNTKLDELRSKLKSDKLSPKETTDIKQEIKSHNKEVASLKDKRDNAETAFNNARNTYKIASSDYDSVLGSMERKSAEASRQVQIYRAYLDIVDSGASIAQNITKLNNTVNHDYKAAMAKVDSETAAYMVNFFSSSAQYARNAASQAIDGMNSVRSGCDASIQNADSSVNYAIRAI